MNLEGFDRKKEDFQYYTDVVFLEIAEFGSIGIDYIDNEVKWKDFLIPILEDMGVSDEQVVKASDFSFSVDPERGTLVVKLKKSEVTREYQVSAEALKKYENEIKPQVLKQEGWDEEARQAEKEALTKLKEIAEENPGVRYSKELYKQIRREDDIKGDFSAEIVNGYLRLTFYGPDGLLDDIKEWPLSLIE